MDVFKTEGIIIKRKDFGETDRILTVFTKHQGKIQAMAKGVRKISSRRSSHVELLNLSVLTFHIARMPILTEAETLNHFTGLKDNLKKVGLAFYVCELIDGLLAEYQENRAVFSLLVQTLNRMEEEKDTRLVISKFEQELLSQLGFWPRERVFLEDSDYFIENIIERRIKSKRILKLFSEPL